uniref:UBC core domain-containing protein n=1 Tax=Cryptomonas curvata TaxID=233186 RepID=A0A7S0QVK3_9CRYP|mmetsp:Transcript_53803/g.112337  ORF Transcript_53803/g.112337 Transcript_53803/m.112337 type:complete len:124 (+) Transcript_53803:117-488(+)
MSSSSSRATLLLAQQLKELHKKPSDYFSAGLTDESNIFEWDICISGPPDTLYEGGIFNCKLIFPPTYPERPPKMKFTTPIWHPNVYTNGDVCISILHEPGEDAFNPQEIFLVFSKGQLGVRGF